MGLFLRRLDIFLLNFEKLLRYNMIYKKYNQLKDIENQLGLCKAVCLAGFIVYKR
ncbi:hypothetical protein FTV88_0132 [Heliorestis convoluta]|uniref:Uncharacterized protein n=1 Tax=Heliorestis convoluta TaxID=356322 RepID=A0A5Q2MX22_9FIRM|nr:hypothetical protein FTV88_0132 [Heliorestis convoluta]